MTRENSKKNTVREKATTHQHSPPHRLTMQPRNNIHTLDAYRPTFDPHLDIATVVFSHVQCVRTRHSLARVSKLWREASKPAAAYPLEFEFDAGCRIWHRGPCMWGTYRRATRLLDNDEALSLPYERVVGLLGETAEYVCNYAASRGSVRLLKWARENNRPWNSDCCSCAVRNGHLSALQYLHENGSPWSQLSSNFAAMYGHLSVLQYLHENGCPWGYITCLYAADREHWDCLQYAVDNKCDKWEIFVEHYAEHLR